MRKRNLSVCLFLFMLCLSCSAFGQGSGTGYSNTTQGGIEPPPPPPGYNVTLPPMEPFTSAPPPPSPPSMAPPVRHAQDVPPQVPSYDPSKPVITPELARYISRLIRSLKTGRTLIDKPESAQEIRRILNTGRVCADLLGLGRFPVPSKFSASSGDRVLRDRSYGAVEYRFYGDFDNRVNGWVRPIETAIYVDMIFDGKSKRRTHVRSQFTRTGPVTGYFYAYSWDAYGNPWKMQGSLENIFVRDDGLPSGGTIKLYGADPSGRVMTLDLAFPVTVLGEKMPAQKDIRHRDGQRVSIGN